METRENFAAPELKEAVGQTVYLSQLEHDATAVIKPYTFMEIGDRVRLTVKTVYGGSFENETVITNGTIGMPITFLVPKTVLAENWSPSENPALTLFYRVERADGNYIESPILELHVKL
ncbi:hypothetical protein [Pseudomonas sp. R1-7]|uniref:hypothetical protein n=1 Tax=Pseudomonas sp. R1-7 TaxID=2817398 RepID=UPI003DA94623